MKITLWVLQILLALAFFAHGWLLLAPPPEIAVQMNASLPRGFWVFLGWAEILAAVGLTLPAATRILPGLVPAAAVGIMIVMISATVYHIRACGVLPGVDHDGAARDGHVRGVRTLAPRAYPPAERCIAPNSSLMAFSALSTSAVVLNTWGDRRIPLNGFAKLFT